MQQVRMTKIFLLTLVIVLFAVPYSYGGVPQLINYQGKLTNAAGSPVPDGSHNVVFKIYDGVGTALWTETWNSGTSQIVTKGGVFNAMLGHYTTIPLSFFTDHPVTYLGITFGTDSEMTPRQRITSVGYAFTAGSAETANSASNGVPRGAIIMWSGAIDQIPAGWALCNGDNGTPDLTGKFIMGTSPQYPLTGGQATINLQHSHTVNDHTHTYSGNTGGYTLTRSHPAHSLQDENSSSNPDHFHGYSGTTSGVSGGGTNNQLSPLQSILPPYYSLAFIMKL